MSRENWFASVSNMSTFKSLDDCKKIVEEMENTKFRQEQRFCKLLEKLRKCNRPEHKGFTQSLRDHNCYMNYLNEVRLIIEALCIMFLKQKTLGQASTGIVTRRNPTTKEQRTPEKIARENAHGPSVQNHPQHEDLEDEIFDAQNSENDNEDGDEVYQN
ncbi:hypothetical protein ACFE04_023915 [Oxalis oulophora]